MAKIGHRGEQHRGGRLLKDRVGHRLARAFEIPEDVVLDIPRITIVGSERVTVENHAGIVEYLPSKVRVNTSCGPITIRGESLLIDKITVEEVRLTGSVRGVGFDGAEEARRTDAP